MLYTMFQYMREWARVKIFRLKPFEFHKPRDHAAPGIEK
jgi:hypothetical protein